MTRGIGCLTITKVGNHSPGTNSVKNYCNENFKNYTWYIYRYSNPFKGHELGLRFFLPGSEKIIKISNLSYRHLIIW